LQVRFSSGPSGLIFFDFFLDFADLSPWPSGCLSLAEGLAGAAAAGGNILRALAGWGGALARPLLLSGSAASGAGLPLP